MHDSDITIVCVGTPSGAGGSLSTEYLESASEEIGAALATKDDFHVVVYRSTMVPGTCENILIPILEQVSGKKAGKDFGVCLNPEFLRECTSVKDFLDPPKTVVGESDERSGDTGHVPLRRPARPAVPGADRRRRDDQVRRQQLPRAQGDLRQRDRARWPPRSGSTRTR